MGENSLRIRNKYFTHLLHFQQFLRTNQNQLKVHLFNIFVVRCLRIYQNCLNYWSKGLVFSGMYWIPRTSPSWVLVNSKKKSKSIKPCLQLEEKLPQHAKWDCFSWSGTGFLSEKDYMKCSHCTRVSVNSWFFSMYQANFFGITGVTYENSFDRV